MEYGPFDKVVAPTDAAGIRHTFAYDTELKLVRVTNPAGRTWDYEHDAAGNLISERDFTGRVQRYAYDAVGQLTRASTEPARSCTWSATPWARSSGNGRTRARRSSPTTSPVGC